MSSSLVVDGSPFTGGVDVVSTVLETARRQPRETAVEDGGVTLDYAALAGLVEAFAGRLAAAGARRGAVVVVELPRSWQEIVAVLAVLRTGAAYNAVDSEAPPQRARQLLAVACPTVVVGSSERARDLSSAARCRLVPPPELDEIATAGHQLPDLPLPMASTAYLAFTSGSTGEPKTVVVPHRAVARLVAGAHEYVPLPTGHRFLRLAPLAFDASTFEIFVPLGAGCRVEVFPAGPVAPLELGSFLRSHEVRVTWLTAGLFRLVADQSPAAFDGLTHLLTGGDVVPPHQVRALLERRRGGLTVVNGYGPTENTTFTTTHSVDDPTRVTDPLPIGRPVLGTGVLVVGDDLDPVADGEVGELLVTGAGLTSGYLDDPDLTARMFPYLPALGGRFYRTGDLVRWERGELLFVGRGDRQVKIRGHRVELSEIESVLREEPTVRDAAAVFGSVQSAPSLVASVVADPETDPARVRDSLREKLPGYMVPTEIAIVGELPLTGNGKVDRDEVLRVVAEPVSDGDAGPVDGRAWQQDEGLDEDGDPPTGPDLELVVGSAWSEVLGHDDFDADEGFFDVGGDSLAAAELHTRLCEALPDHHIRVVDVFAHPTVTTFAAHLRSAGPAVLAE